MRAGPPVNRRSFLGRVASAGLGGGFLTLIVGGRAVAGTDHDRADPGTRYTDRDRYDLRGRGRGARNGVSDTDPTDRRGYGRGGLTDRDPVDPPGLGRGPVADSDVADASDHDVVDRHGRGRGVGGKPSGLTDGDPVDRASWGRGAPR